MLVGKIGLEIAITRVGIKKLCFFILHFETATSKSVCHLGGGEKLGKKGKYE